MGLGRWLFLLTCFFTASLALADEKAVHVRGTGALQSMAQFMAEAYMREHPGSTIVVGAGGTFRGYKSLLDGTADIAMVSSSVQENVADLLTQSSPDFVRTVVAYSALVPVVHPDNALRSLSIVQLRDVFSGHIRNWKELGGKDAAIVTLVGPPTDGLTASWRERVLGPFNSYSPKGVVTDADERVRRVARDRHAISFVWLADVNSRVRPLAVDGQQAAPEKLRDGSYPLSAPLLLVTTTASSTQTRSFLQYFSTPNKQPRLQGIIPAKALD
jgi:phosphate transport system substrate-binding protein